jgi:tetratricopeptide (TPR) repeat protein
MHLENRRSTHLTATFLALAALSSGAVPELSAMEHQHDTPAASQVIAQADLGAVTFPITCGPEVQTDFERAVALLHHMRYVEAHRSFSRIEEEHPDCGMAAWGVAMTLFQPLWPTRPSPADLTAGWKAVERARALVAGDEREEAFVAAAGAFFLEPESADYWTRIHRFEAAMDEARRSYPEDPEVAAFYALSHLATAPQATEPLLHNAAAAEILLEIWEAEPTHPGAIHYTIHANDIDGREGESLDVVASYGVIAPSVPHALHMPTHIYVRLGDWDEVIRWNERSAEAALDFPAGDALSHHYPHALDYLIYAHLQRGEVERAGEVLARLDIGERYQETFVSAYHLAAMPARYAVERHEWKSAAALSERHPENYPWERFPWAEAITQFARGIGSARSGDPAGAREALEKLVALRDRATASGEDYFATQIEISRLAVAAWLAHAEGSSSAAVHLMRSAVRLEASTEKHPVTPGSLAPASELLGDLLMELDQPGAALEAYRASLRTWPGRRNSLEGAAHAESARASLLAIPSSG